MFVVGDIQIIQLLQQLLRIANGFERGNPAVPAVLALVIITITNKNPFETDGRDKVIFWRLNLYFQNSYMEQQYNVM
jgi:hypothetical protein